MSNRPQYERIARAYSDSRKHQIAIDMLTAIITSSRFKSSGRPMDGRPTTGEVVFTYRAKEHEFDILHATVCEIRDGFYRHIDVAPSKLDNLITVTVRPPQERR